LRAETSHNIPQHQLLWAVHAELHFAGTEELVFRPRKLCQIGWERFDRFACSLLIRLYLRRKLLDFVPYILQKGINHRVNHFVTNFLVFLAQAELAPDLGELSLDGKFYFRLEIVVDNLRFFKKIYIIILPLKENDIASKLSLLVCVSGESDKTRETFSPAVGDKPSPSAEPPTKIANKGTMLNNIAQDNLA
jgi:hypothetical protein